MRGFVPPAYVRSASFHNTAAVPISLQCDFKDSQSTHTYDLAPGSTMEISRSVDKGGWSAADPLTKVVVIEQKTKAVLQEIALGSDFGVKVMHYLVSTSADAEKKVTVKEMSSEDWDILMEMLERAGKGESGGPQTTSVDANSSINELWGAVGRVSTQQDKIPSKKVEAGHKPKVPSVNSVHPLMTTSGGMSHKEDQPRLQAKSLPNEYQVEPLNGPNSQMIIIAVKRSQLDLPLEDYYDESSIQLYLKHVGQGKFVKTPQYKTLTLNARAKKAFEDTQIYWPDLLKQTLTLEESVISWCFTRDGRHCLVLKQSTAVDPESEFRTIFQWTLHLYRFDSEAEPLAYQSVVHPQQLLYPEVCQATLRKFILYKGNEDFSQYSNISGTEVLMALSDDEGSLIIYDNLRRELHMLDQVGEDQGIVRLMQQVDLQAKYEKQHIGCLMTVASLTMQGETLYLKSGSKLHEIENLRSWEDLQTPKASTVLEIWQCNAFNLIIFEKAVQVYDVLTQSICDDVKNIGGINLAKNNGLCSYAQRDNTYNLHKVACLRYTFQGESRIEILQVKRLETQKAFSYELSVIQTIPLSLEGQRETTACLTRYLAPGYFFLNLIVETQMYFQKWKVAHDTTAELVDSMACQPKFFGLQTPEFFPHYPLGVRALANLTTATPERYREDNIFEEVHLGVASPQLFKEVQKLTQITLLSRDGVQDSSFTVVPEMDLMIYPQLAQSYLRLNKNSPNDRTTENFRYEELALVQPTTGQVNHLKFRRNFAFKHFRYYDGTLFILFMDVSFNLLTMVITKDFEVKLYSFEDKMDGPYHVTSDCRALFMFTNISCMCNSYTFDQETGWILVKEINIWKNTLQEIEMRFTHTDNIDLSVQLDIQSIVFYCGNKQFSEFKGMRMVSFQNTHQVVYDTQRAHFLSNHNLRVQTVIKFKNKVKEIIVLNGSLYYKDEKNRTYEVKVAQDLPGYIPSQLFFNERLITIYEEGTGELQFYESFTKTDPLQMLAALKFRSHFDPVLECVADQQVNLDPLLDLIRLQDLHPLFSYSLLSRSNIFSRTEDYKYRDKLYRLLELKLDQLEPSDLQTLLMHDLCITTFYSRTIFNIMLDKQANSLIQAVIGHMTRQDVTGLLYQGLHEYFAKLNHAKIDLKGYLESQVGLMQVSDEFYWPNASNQDRVMWPVNQQTVGQIIDQFQDIETDIPSQQMLLFGQHNEEIYPIQYLLINMHDRVKGVETEEINQRLMVQIIMSMARRDPSVLEIESLKLIIEFKWQKYTRAFFAVQLFLFLIFTVAFILDVISISRVGFDVDNSIQLVTRIICIVVTVIFALYEMVDFFRGVRDYLGKFWNLNDFANILVYTTFFILSFAGPQQVYALKSLQCVVVIVAFIKLCYLIRIFTKLSFLVQMLLNVFYDLRYFLMFFAMVVGAMTVMLQILLKTSGEAYEGIRGVAFYVIALRESIGDYDTSAIIEGSKGDFIILVWLLWFLILIVGNVVFMNFIIAVVSESYENCMERMTQSVQGAKLEMIEECESLLPASYFSDEKLFPRYILVRRPANEEDTGEDSEWQGFVKQMKRHFDKETLIMRTEFDKQRRSINEMRKLIEGQKRAQEESDREINEKIDYLIKKVKGGDVPLKQKVAHAPFK